MKEPTPNLGTVAAAFDHWRSNKKRGERIPPHLWQQAAGLRGHYKISHIIKALKTSAAQYNQQCPPSVTSQQSTSISPRPKKSSKTKSTLFEVPAIAINNQGTGSMTFTRQDGSTVVVALSNVEQAQQLLTWFLGSSSCYS